MAQNEPMEKLFTRRHIPKDCNLHIHNHKETGSYILTKCLECRLQIKIRTPEHLFKAGGTELFPRGVQAAYPAFRESWIN
jgi:hypothetical protein